MIDRKNKEKAVRLMIVSILLVSMFLLARETAEYTMSTEIKEKKKCVVIDAGSVASIGFVEDGILYQVWLENEKSLEVKLNVMKANSLAGVAAWKLGFERSGAWDVIEAHYGS